MSGSNRDWGTHEWESYCTLLLHRRYNTPPGSYQPIPSETHGDCGLEGFAVDGSAYQCYSAQKWSTSAQLYQRQRDKITHDLNTFVSKQAELCKLLGPNKIKAWNLLVPFWNNKDLIKHARVKEEEIRALKLPHADENFRVSILTDDNFSVEAKQLLDHNLGKFKPAKSEITDKQLIEWEAELENSELLSNLLSKAQVLGQDQPPEAIKQFSREQIKHYISGNLALQQLYAEAPETFETVQSLKNDRESELAAETFVRVKVPAELFTQTLASFKESLIATPGISRHVAAILAFEAVSDWLLRCPMNF